MGIPLRLALIGLVGSARGFELSEPLAGLACDSDTDGETLELGHRQLDVTATNWLEAGIDLCAEECEQIAGCTTFHVMQSNDCFDEAGTNVCVPWAECTFFSRCEALQHGLALDGQHLMDCSSTAYFLTDRTSAPALPSTADRRHLQMSMGAAFPSMAAMDMGLSMPMNMMDMGGSPMTSMGNVFQGNSLPPIIAPETVVTVDPTVAEAPCGCEVLGEKFCNYDYGATGFCQACYATENNVVLEPVVDCVDRDLPEAGAADCYKWCPPETYSPHGVQTLPAKQFTITVTAEGTVDDFDKAGYETKMRTYLGCDAPLCKVDIDVTAASVKVEATVTDTDASVGGGAVAKAEMLKNTPLDELTAALGVTVLSAPVVTAPIEVQLTVPTPASSPPPSPTSPSPSQPPPSPSLPPPSPSPPPPPPRKLGGRVGEKIGEKSSDQTTAEDVGLGAGLGLGLGFPVFCAFLFFLHVQLNFAEGKRSKYLKYRFSHTNAKINCGYMPKESRDALWAEIKAPAAQSGRDTAVEIPAVAPKKEKTDTV